MAIELTKDNFEKEVLNSSDVVLVDFWASWCGPCQMLLPIVEELSNELESGAKIGKVNVDEQPELASKYGVMSIPTLKIFKNGEIVEETVGVHSKEDLIQMINNHR